MVLLDRQGVAGWVTDGGLETDLLFQRGIDLPEFAAFPLVPDPATAAVLVSYYRDYAAIAESASAGLVLESPTWRANSDWGRQLGYDAAQLDAVNREAVQLLRRFASDLDLEHVLISGVVGPRGDGYIAAGRSADAAAEYHVAQVASLADEGVDVVHAMTLSEPAEAIGVVRAARQAGVPVAVSFTVETDGRLPDGTPLRDAVASVDEAAAPDWFGVNCAHPTHIRPALDGGDWQRRLRSYRPNASTLTHAELDVMEELDTGDVDLLVRESRELRDLLPLLSIVGGCCGTDASHVASMWGVTTPPTCR
jgi:S-methylmethionine-dependent homocysteine/selenocysteine methylase